MEKCSCYYTQKKTNYSLSGEFQWDTLEGHCNGTKERDICSCGGDKAKCDFYENVRKEGRKNMEPMNTSTMWLKAQEDGKMYNTTDLYYHRSLGFVDSNYNPWRRVDATDLMKIHDWKEVETKNPIMSKEEAEEKYGIKIVG